MEMAGAQGERGKWTVVLNGEDIKIDGDDVDQVRTLGGYSKPSSLARETA